MASGIALRRAQAEPLGELADDLDALESNRC